MPNSKEMFDRENGHLIIHQQSQRKNRNSSEEKQVLEFEEFAETLPALASKLPNSPEIEQLKAWKQDLGWLSTLRQASRVLMAAIAPGSFRITYANDYFCRLFGITATNTGVVNQDVTLFDLFADLDKASLLEWYRRHVLYQLLRQRYGIHSHKSADLKESTVVTVQSPLYEEPRFIEFWLSSQGLKVSLVDAAADTWTDTWTDFIGTANIKTDDPENVLKDSPQLDTLVQQLSPENYLVEGLLLLEGLDVTTQKQMQQITQMLIGPESILRPEGFRHLDQGLRSLFGADKSLILSAEQDPARLFSETESQELTVTNYSFEFLRGSHFQQASHKNQIWNVPDLRSNAPTECDRQLLESGVNSLLLIPLAISSTHHGDNGDNGQPQTVGLVGLTSRHPDHFHHTDLRLGEQLIAPFTVALRQALQQRMTLFSNIHPSVEARFVQEAERRSWGLLPEPIVFRHVYPLYGISDIRGSSKERNRAIQQDLLAQFKLGMTIVDAVTEYQQSPFVEQLRLDLIEQIQHLQAEVTVDSEVSAIEYLQNNLEIYFDYFAQCSPTAAQAVQKYQQACDNEHQCIYTARSRYDETVHQINQCLRETWERWQVTMQNIIPHYCDIECTDGIDHMIYVGKSIHADFCLFHLRSLRYEQLKAVCDCARTALKIQAEYDSQMELTHLVLVQNTSIDIFHDEKTERLFDVGGTRDTRYEIVKKRIDKGVDERSQERITQPGMLTLVYSTNQEWEEYQKYLCYLAREGWVEPKIQYGNVQPLQGVTGLKFARVRVLA
jgi:hypothetical protein